MPHQCKLAAQKGSATEQALTYLDPARDGEFAAKKGSATEQASTYLEPACDTEQKVETSLDASARKRTWYSRTRTH